MNGNLPSRKPLRLSDYDYSQSGAYFITICSHGRLCIFGDVHDGQVLLNHRGQILKQCWDEIPTHYTNVTLDEFVIMPNHVHGIVFIAGPQDLLAGGSETRPYKRVSVPEIVRALKGFSSRCMNQAGLAEGATIWQRGFYDHVIRNEGSLAAIREYILSNPLNWEQDDLNPKSAQTAMPQRHRG